MALPIWKSHFFYPPNMPHFKEQMPFDAAIMFLIFWIN